MKFFIDNELVAELSETDKKIIQNDIPAAEFANEMKRRIVWVIEHKLSQCRKRLENQWIPIISETAESIPTNKDTRIQMILAHKNYKDRAQRDDEERQSRENTAQNSK